MDADGGLFADQRLQAVLQRCGQASPEGMIRAVVDKVSRYCGSVTQSDDITALAIRYRGSR
jgi:serine phosphatase RsbU (regulator of sigma subunit)